jgi:hypothetical protein
MVSTGSVALIFINVPRQNWNTKATDSRSSTLRLSYALPATVLGSIDSQAAIIFTAHVVEIHEPPCAVREGAVVQLLFRRRCVGSRQDI